jgi:hypothetical protein
MKDLKEVKGRTPPGFCLVYAKIRTSKADYLLLINRTSLPYKKKRKSGTGEISIGLDVQVGRG